MKVLVTAHLKIWLEKSLKHQRPTPRTVLTIHPTAPTSGWIVDMEQRLRSQQRCSPKWSSQGPPGLKGMKHSIVGFFSWAKIIEWKTFCHQKKRPLLHEMGKFLWSLFGSFWASNKHWTFTWIKLQWWKWIWNKKTCWKKRARFENYHWHLRISFSNCFWLDHYTT